MQLSYVLAKKFPPKKNLSCGVTVVSLHIETALLSDSWRHTPSDKEQNCQHLLDHFPVQITQPCSESGYQATVSLVGFLSTKTCGEARRGTAEGWVACWNLSSTTSVFYRWVRAGLRTSLAPLDLNLKNMLFHVYGKAPFSHITNTAALALRFETTRLTRHGALQHVIYVIAHTPLIPVFLFSFLSSPTSL